MDGAIDGGCKEQTYPVILELDNADSQVGNLSTLVFGFRSLRVDPSILGAEFFQNPRGFLGMKKNPRGVSHNNIYCRSI